LVVSLSSVLFHSLTNQLWPDITISYLLFSLSSLNVVA